MLFRGVGEPSAVAFQELFPVLMADPLSSLSVLYLRFLLAEPLARLNFRAIAE